MPLMQEERGSALFLTWQRPPLNVLDLAALGELRDALAGAAAQPGLKSVVLRSGIPGVFSAGVDVKDHVKERVPEMLSRVHAVVLLLAELPQVSLALVDGLCLGGGCEIAAACDIVLASPRASFGQPEIDVGCFPPVATALLPRQIGRRGVEMILTGERIDGEEAARLGLASRVVPDVEVAAARLIQTLDQKSGRVLALARRAIREGREEGIGSALARTERVYLDELLATQDVEEGVRAFLEKRRPNWSNR